MNENINFDGKNLFELMLLSTLDIKTKHIYKICKKYGIKTEDFIPFLLELSAMIQSFTEENDNGKN